jgi:NNP family nitrate/nitrite transporter-like MFS transporter
MTENQPAQRIDWFNFSTPPMRAFHCTWGAFFVCFFAWFGLAPLTPIIREEMNLSSQQVGNLVIASVAATILARLIIGPLCDRWGPRLTYTCLLCVGSLPVMGVGLAQNYESLLWFRFAIGIIGASFVVTQFHTSTMFAKNCVGTANAAAAGWGNLGGGVTQQVMPLAVAGLMALGVSSFWAWRGAMFAAGSTCFAAGIAYYLLTQDGPAGNFRQLRASGRIPPRKRTELSAFWLACRDGRVWGLAAAYGACFGVELTIDNIAATYFFDRFDLGYAGAGVVAGLFGAMNLFARLLGGWIADRAGQRWGLGGRTGWLTATLVAEGALLWLFAQMGHVAAAIPLMLLMGLFVKMSNGATYAVAPLIHRGNLGAVAGIIGAGGNVGAVLAGFLFRAPPDEWPAALETLGLAVLLCAAAPLAITLFERLAASRGEEGELAAGLEV